MADKSAYIHTKLSGVSLVAPFGSGALARVASGEVEHMGETMTMGSRDSASGRKEGTRKEVVDALVSVAR